MPTIPVGVPAPRSSLSAVPFAPDSAQGITRRVNVTGNRPPLSDLDKFAALQSTLPRAPDGDGLSTSKSRKEVKESWRKDANPNVFDIDKVAEKYGEAQKSGVNAAKRSFFFKLGSTLALGIAAIAVTVLIATGVGAPVGLGVLAALGIMTAKSALDTANSNMLLTNARAEAKGLGPVYDLPMGDSAMGNLIFKGLEKLKVNPETCKKWAKAGSLGFDLISNTATCFLLGGITALPYVAIAQIATISLFLLNKHSDQLTTKTTDEIFDSFKRLQKDIDQAHQELQQLPEGSVARSQIEENLNALQDRLNDQLEQLTEKIDAAIEKNSAPEGIGIHYLFAGAVLTGGVMALGHYVPESHPQTSLLGLSAGVSGLRWAFTLHNQDQQFQSILQKHDDMAILMSNLELQQQIAVHEAEPEQIQPLPNNFAGFV
jgi:hypothetical protein